MENILKLTLGLVLGVESATAMQLPSDFIERDTSVELSHLMSWGSSEDLASSTELPSVDFSKSERDYIDAYSEAVVRGKTKAADYLRTHLNLETSDPESADVSPVTRACKRSDWNLIVSLVNTGAKLNNAIFEQLCDERMIDGFGLLIRASRYATNADINSPALFNYVCRFGTVDFLKLMVERLGADVNQTDWITKLTPMHYCAMSTCGNENLQYLISQNALINCLDARGFSPLGYAIEFGNLDIVRYLIDNNLVDLSLKGYGTYAGYLDQAARFGVATKCFDLATYLSQNL